MNATSDLQTVLTDLLGRVREHVHDVLEGASQADLEARPAAEANSVGWLVWHLTRVLDDHLAALAGSPQVWDEWASRLDLPLEHHDIGYGHTSEQVASVRASAADLRGYHDAVQDRTAEILADLAGTEMGRVVDDRWDPPVTLGVRLVSVIDDCIQHAGQAAYARGLRAQED